MVQPISAGTRWEKLKEKKQSIGHFSEGTEKYIPDGGKWGKAEGEKIEHFSYFGSNGWLRTGWIKLGKGTADPDENTAQHWSYFGDNGWLRTGWQKMGKGTSQDKGAAFHWSYFGSDGWLRTGWQTMGTKTNPDPGAEVHISYFGGNGWLATGNKKIGNAICSFGWNGWLTGVKYTIQKLINQRNTGFGSMGCGGATGVMAMQANGFNKGLRQSGYRSFFFDSVARSSDSRYGWNNSNGIWNPALTDWIRGKTGGKAFRVSGITSSKIKDYLVHGQTVAVLIPSGSITHWVTIYGYDKNTFFVADPWGATEYSATGRLYNLSGPDLDRKLQDAANRKGRVNGEYTREGVTYGIYKFP